MSLLRRLSYVIRHGSYIPTEYYVDDARQLVYIPIPKVACTSIKEAIFGETNTEEHYSEYMGIHSTLSSRSVNKLHRKQANYYKFAFVRNPLARLVSCYLDKVIRPRQHTGHYYFDSRYSRWLLSSIAGTKISSTMTFANFVQAVSRIPDWVADGHFRSQCHFLFGKNTAHPDFIGRFEDIGKDWHTLASQHQLRDLAHRNPTDAYQLADWYQDAKTLDLVRKRYACDIEKWYSNEYESLRESLK